MGNLMDKKRSFFEENHGLSSPLIVDPPFVSHLANTLKIDGELMKKERSTFYSFLEKIFGKESDVKKFLMDEYSKMNDFYGSDNRVYGDISLYEFASILDEIKVRLRKNGKNDDDQELQTVYYAMSAVQDYVLGGSINEEQVSSEVKTESWTYSLENFSVKDSLIKDVLFREQDCRRWERYTFSSFLEKFFGKESTVVKVLMNEYEEVIGGDVSRDMSLYELALILDKITIELSKKDEDENSQESKKDEVSKEFKLQTLYYAKSVVKNYVIGSREVKESVLVLIDKYLYERFWFRDERLYNSLYRYLWLDEYPDGYPEEVDVFLKSFNSWVKTYEDFISGIVNEHSEKPERE